MRVRGFGGSQISGSVHFADRIHMNAEGYKLWTEIVRPFLPAADG